MSVSCYAPTREAKREDKHQFYGYLTKALTSVPDNDIDVFVGDFNAC